MTDVSDVLRDRMQTPAGLQRMLTVSVAVHLVLAAGLIFAPGGLLKRAADAPRTVMTISLGGGGEGPENGGMTPMGGRPVQTVAPPEELAKREPVRPPAAKTEMTVPLPDSKPLKIAPKPQVKQAPDEARGRTPTRGAQTSAGTTVADTGVRGQGFGLSTGGGPGTGSSLDVADFCCPDYIAIMVTRIRSVWDQRQGAVGNAYVKFTIQRDGRLTNVELERSSGVTPLDIAAMRAVSTTGSLPALPDAFPNPTLTVKLQFEYK